MKITIVLGAFLPVPPVNGWRLHPEKGVHLLVEAFARLRRGEFADWKLLIVGSTDSREGRRR